MATNTSQPNKKRVSTAKSKPSRGQRALLIVALLIALICAFALVRHIQNTRAIAADKARFAQAEQDVQSATNQLVTIIGKPADSKSKNTCTQSVVEFGENTFSCNIGNYLAYGLDTYEQANQIVDKTSKTTHPSFNNWTFEEVTQKPSHDSSTFSPIINPTGIESLTELYSDPKTKLTCNISYDF